jgi:hypothetical protein
MARYGDMDADEAAEGKHPRDDDARLKKQVADLSLDKERLQVVIKKKDSPGSHANNMDPLLVTRRRTEGSREALAAGVLWKRASRRLHHLDKMPFMDPVCEPM